MFLSLRRWFKKKGPSAWGAAELRARAVLAERPLYRGRLGLQISWIPEMDGDRVSAVMGWTRFAEPVGGADADVLAAEATLV